jgi:hypothetical protein
MPSPDTCIYEPAQGPARIWPYYGDPDHPVIRAGDPEGEGIVSSLFQHVLKWAKDPDAARAVRAFLTGARGRSVLKQYGFFLPEE